jgi:hypothetical protein
MRAAIAGFAGRGYGRKAWSGCLRLPGSHILNVKSRLQKEVITSRSVHFENWVDCCLVLVRRDKLTNEHHTELPDNLVMGPIQPFFKDNWTILVKCNASFYTHSIVPFNDIAPSICFFQIRQSRSVRLRGMNMTFEVLFRETPKDLFRGWFLLGLLTFVELSVEIAADVETPSCDEDCCVLVALGSEHADGEGVEEWVEKNGVETVRRVRGKMHRSTSPVVNVAYKVSIWMNNGITISLSVESG